MLQDPIDNSALTLKGFLVNITLKGYPAAYSSWPLTALQGYACMRYSGCQKVPILLSVRPCTCEGDWRDSYY